MSLSGLAEALVEYVNDVLVHDCGRPVPARLLRYFGTDGLPQDCCTEEGTLSVAVDRGYPTQSFPADVGGGGNPCQVWPAYVLAIRYDTCWKLPEVDPETGMTLLDDDWDGDAATLMDVMDCVTRSLIQLTCTEGQTVANAYAQAVLDRLRGCTMIRFREVVPNAHPGSCARITWRVYVGPKATEPPS